MYTLKNCGQTFHQNSSLFTKASVHRFCSFRVSHPHCVATVMKYNEDNFSAWFKPGLSPIFWSDLIHHQWRACIVLHGFRWGKLWRHVYALPFVVKRSAFLIYFISFYYLYTKGICSLWSICECTIVTFNSSSPGSSSDLWGLTLMNSRFLVQILFWVRESKIKVQLLFDYIFSFYYL